MRLDLSFGIHEGGEVGIQRPDERLDGHAFSRAALAVLQECEQDGVEGTRGGGIAWERKVGDEVRGVLGLAVAADVVGLGELWGRQVWIHDSGLVVVE